MAEISVAPSKSNNLDWHVFFSISGFQCYCGQIIRKPVCVEVLAAAAVVFIVEAHLMQVRVVGLFMGIWCNIVSALKREVLLSLKSTGSCTSSANF